MGISLKSKVDNYVTCKVQDLAEHQKSDESSHFLVKSYLNFEENYENDESAALEFWDKKNSGFCGLSNVSEDTFKFVDPRLHC